MEDGASIRNHGESKRITEIRSEHRSRMECNIVIISNPLVEIHHTCFVKLFDNTALMMMVITSSCKYLIYSLMSSIRW